MIVGVGGRRVGTRRSDGPGGSAAATAVLSELHGRGFGGAVIGQAGFSLIAVPAEDAQAADVGVFHEIKPAVVGAGSVVGPLSDRDLEYPRMRKSRDRAKSQTHQH